MKKDCSAYPKVKKVKKSKEPKFFMQAHLIRLGVGPFDGSRFLARIPLIITVVPELPEAVTCEGHCYTLTRTFPLTYTSVLAARATRI